MSVWKRVRQYSKDKVTSIIHGKAWHEETKATSSQATASGKRPLPGGLHAGGNRLRLRLHPQRRRQGGVSWRSSRAPIPRDSIPTLHLQTIGVANQTTMLRGETEEVQRRLREAMIQNFGEAESGQTFSLLSTPSAGRRRTARTRWRNSCASRWICCWSSAATIPPTLRTWRRWARPSCPPTSSRTRPRWFRTS